MWPECCGRQGLGHNISKVVVGGDMLEVDFSMFEGLMYVVVLYFDVLCSLVESWVLNQLNSSLVVDIKNNRCIW